MKYVICILSINYRTSYLLLITRKQNQYNLMIASLNFIDLNRNSKCKCSHERTVINYFF